MDTTTPSSFPFGVIRADALFTQPMAMAAASTALGFGLAGQAFGMWMGAMTGAMEAMNRLPMAQPSKRSADAFRPQASPSARAKAAVATLAADAATVAREASKAITDAVSKTAVETVVAQEKAVASLKPVALDRPESPDDLKAISGIGPKLEKVLNDLGIWTYGQIAGWGQSQIGWVDDLLSFNGRIARDKWIEQAVALAKRD